ncbi:MAG TPA: dihydrofolate reductase [Telluria sp.]|nr:dihydrofolate reductase [Telluria sp.]
MNGHSLSLVVAMETSRGIGRDNAMPWHLPEDLAHFKRVTTGHPIIMGRRTFDSIGRPLPQRRNIVITRDAAWSHAGAERAGSLDEAIAMVGNEQACIIGGGQIFAEALERNLADRVIVTEIDHDFACDTFFPPLPPGWRETARERHHSPGNGFDFSYVTHERED